MNRPDHLRLPTCAEPTCQRHDARCRDIVEQALSVQQQCNTMSAIEYLKAHDIDARVIERVLLYPQQRRGQLPH